MGVLYLKTVCTKAVSIHDILDLYQNSITCKLGFQVCGNDRSIPTQTLTDDRDEQNSIVLRQNADIKRTTIATR